MNNDGNEDLLFYTRLIECGFVFRNSCAYWKFHRAKLSVSSQRDQVWKKSPHRIWLLREFSDFVYFFSFLQSMSWCIALPTSRKFVLPEMEHSSYVCKFYWMFCCKFLSQCNYFQIKLSFPSWDIDIWSLHILTLNPVKRSNKHHGEARAKSGPKACKCILITNFFTYLRKWFYFTVSDIISSVATNRCAVLSEADYGEPVHEFYVVQRTLLPRAIPRSCSYCHRESNRNVNVSLKRCTRCYKTSYCDTYVIESFWESKIFYI